MVQDNRSGSWNFSSLYSSYTYSKESTDKRWSKNFTMATFGNFAVKVEKRKKNASGFMIMIEEAKKKRINDAVNDNNNHNLYFLNKFVSFILICCAIKN